MPTATHFAALAALSRDPDADGARMYRQLRRVELPLNRAAEDACNTVVGHLRWEGLEEDAVESARRIFGGWLPVGFFVNSDPRGYALKIDNEQRTHGLPDGLRRDWGGYGLLAPSLKGD